jgi:hypothetical protein
MIVAATIMPTYSMLVVRLFSLNPIGSWEQEATVITSFVHAGSRSREDVGVSHLLGIPLTIPLKLSLAAPTPARTIPTPPRIMRPNIGTHYRIVVAV